MRGKINQPFPNLGKHWDQNVFLARTQEIFLILSKLSVKPSNLSASERVQLLCLGEQSTQPVGRLECLLLNTCFTGLEPGCHEQGRTVPTEAVEGGIFPLNLVRQHNSRNCNSKDKEQETPRVSKNLVSVNFHQSQGKFTCRWL